jgi:mono/diheme cytochrome c family protein
MTFKVGWKSRVALTAVLLFAEGNGSSTADSPAGDRAKGRAAFEQYCMVCHGPQGLGDGPMAKASTPPAPNLTAREVKNKKDQDLMSTIADGKGNGMPAWRGILTDQGLLDIIAYLRSLGN